MQTLNRGECTALVTPLQRHEAAEMPGKPALVGRSTLIGDVEGAMLEAALEAIATAARPQHWNLVAPARFST